MPNNIDDGVIDAFGTAPVPVKLIAVGLVAALELIVMVAGIAPVTLGAKMRLSVHVDEGIIVIGPPVSGAPPTADPKPQ